MKKTMAISVVSAMLFTMGTAAFADITTGVVGEEKYEWPNQFGFKNKIQVIREEQNISTDLEENNNLNLQPGDNIYLPLYYTTKEGETVTIGASKEEMTGHVPYTGEIDKKWKINLIDKSREMVETADFYKAESKDKNLIKGAIYVKVQTKEEYNSLDDMNYKLSVFVSEKYSQNKTEQIDVEGTFGNPKAEKPVDFDWENAVFGKAVWEVNKDEDGTATFNFKDDAYYTVKMFGGDKVMFDFDRNYNKEIANRYSEDLYFYNFRGNLDTFSATGTLTIPTDVPMYMYEVVNNNLKATAAVYNEETEAVELKTKSLGEYVLTPTKLDISAEIQDENTDAQQEQKPSGGENQENNDYFGGGSNSDKVNPNTGAEDMVTLAAVLAVVSIAGGAVLSRKTK